MRVHVTGDVIPTPDLHNARSRLVEIRTLSI